MASTPATLFDRIGGEPVVSAMIDEFYARVLGDSELRPFFDGTSVERLTNMQKEFFAAALDGPMKTTAFDLRAIHAGLGITRAHLTRFVDHLIAVLEDHQAINAKESMEIIYRIAIYSDQVIGDAGGVDG